MDFVRWALGLSEVYGVAFGVNDTENDEEAFVKEGNLPASDAWVICPECGYPIYKSDCMEVESEDWECPCCGFTREDE